MHWEGLGENWKLDSKAFGAWELGAWFLGEEKTDVQNFIPLLDDKCYIPL